MGVVVIGFGYFVWKVDMGWLLCFLGVELILMWMEVRYGCFCVL